MKLILLDENVPRLRAIPTELDVRHVLSLGKSLSDTNIWDYAKEHDAVILTKDADFSHRISLSDPPPRIVRLQLGNLRYRDLVNFIEKVWPEIEKLLASAKLVNVLHDRLEGIR